MENKLGVQISPKSNLDYSVSAVMPISTLYPDNFRIKNPPIKKYSQEAVGACVAFSIKELIECFNKTQYGREIEVSAGFIYSNREKTDATFNLDTGMFPVEALYNTKKKGACEQKYCQWIGEFKEVKDAVVAGTFLPKEAYDNAYNFRIGEYLRANTDEERMSALMNNGGLLICIPITDKYKNGISEQISPDYRGGFKGYHCEITTGFKTINGIKYWELWNTWDYSDSEVNGFNYIPFGYPISESWAISDCNNADTKPIDINQYPKEFRVQIKSSGLKNFKTKDEAKSTVTRILAEGFKNYALVEDKKNGGFYIQVGAFYKKLDAVNRQRELNNKMIFNVAIQDIY